MALLPAQVGPGWSYFPNPGVQVEDHNCGPTSVATGKVGFEDRSGPPNILLEIFSQFDSATDAGDHMPRVAGREGCFIKSGVAARPIKFDGTDEAYAYEYRGSDGYKYSVAVFRRGPLVIYLSSTIDLRRLQGIADAAARKAAQGSA